MRAPLALASLGTALSAVLLVRGWELAAGAPPGGGACALFGGGCDEALRGGGARFLGIPLAAWGVVHFGTLAACLIGSGLLAPPHGPDLGRGAAALCWAGAAAGAALLASMALGAAPFCPLCAAVHGTSFALLALRFARPAPLPPPADAADAASALRSAVLLLPAFAALALFQWAGLSEARREAARPKPLEPEAALAAFRMAAKREIPDDPGSPALGPADAPVSLVVFSDFRCPACRALEDRLAEIERRFPGRVRVSFRHFPLDAACSPVPGADGHPGACAAALLAEAARRQGRFDEARRALFAAQERAAPPSAAELARDAGLDAARLAADAGDPTVAARVAADAALGARLGLREVPAVFLNGRRVPDLRLSTLAYLVAHEAMAAEAGPTPSSGESTGGAARATRLR